MSDTLLCVLLPPDASLSDAIQRRYERAAERNLLPALTWITRGRFATAIARDPTGAGGEALVSSTQRLVGIGRVRLDNREEVAAWTRAGEAQNATTSDLDLVVRAIDERGPKCIPHLIGDFAFAVWDADEQRLVAARDALGIRSLFYAEEPGLLSLSTRAALLAPAAEQYDLEYITEYLLGSNSLEHSIFAGVSAIPPGSMLTRHCGTSAVRRFWSPATLEVDERLSEKPALQCERFLELFSDAVRVRLTGHDDVWVQLSGGLDSSSVASMAQVLAGAGEVPSGIAGTATIVAGMGGDEREYSDAVVRQYRLRNEVLSNHWLWQDDETGPPLSDSPYPAYPMYVRDRCTASLIRTGGGRVLLTGHGSDQYLTGNLLFFADWIARGRVGRALRELSRWSIAERRSFWRLAFHFGALPLLPSAIQRRFGRGGSAPEWIPRSFARRFDVTSRLPLVRQFGVRAGHKFNGSAADSLERRTADPAGWVIGEAIEVRYPFLHRPLVEFALQLPPDLLIRPRTTKWVLREAMYGILPELIRSRRTKGAIDGRIEWSLVRERERIDAMLSRSVLGALGCVDVASLKSAVQAAREGDGVSLGAVLPALSLETWLQVRSGRWSLGAHQDRTGT